jgi:hypothetical protein
MNKYIFHFVSVEGNWDREIHNNRIKRAAKILESNKSAFVIASGTYAPDPYSSFYDGPLGRYTAETLIKKYNISPERIIPAYIVPFDYTYTIIDSYANAAFIGWLTCGLKQRYDEINVLFEPCTSQFHGLRVEMLNNRACNYLHDFQVNVDLLCNNKLTKKELKRDHPGEIERLNAMKEKGGLLYNGEWLDDGINKSFDDIVEVSRLINTVFSNALNISSSEIDLGNWTDNERLLLLMSLNQKVNTHHIDEESIQFLTDIINNNHKVQLPRSAIEKISSLLVK